MAKNIDLINAAFMSKREANYVPLSPLSFLERTLNSIQKESPLFMGSENIAGAILMSGA